ncbi:hypothetical protein [Subtercola sp. RTI3]|uniref:hypothetical protein n=1 Tax=Subtercola sp. RTI3 TaxID=3048639 RepID=UPI002B225254|nr:hypothetical protein [Subtercola sp. RTI3]MEA9985049.1 hypothetical protein [Subtercola sp. RTI3]
MRNSELHPILRSLYQIERSQSVPKVIVDAIFARETGVVLHGVSGWEIQLSYDADLPTVFSQMSEVEAHLQPPSEDEAFGMLPSDSIANNWIESHYDLGTHESGLARHSEGLHYLAISLDGSKTHITVGNGVDSFTFDQELGPGFESVGVPYDIADAYLFAHRD